MNILVSCLEHSLAPIALREKLSFTKVQTGQMTVSVKALNEVSGCVLISTCNRTEVYITSPRILNPGQLLCQCAGLPYGPYQNAFITLEGEEAVNHLMEVAAGLRSRIWGEDQILSQVKNALVISREAGTADSILETLFRWAVAAGKEIRSEIHLTSLPSSAAAMAAACAEKALGSLEGKHGLVIGNGEMGRLAASLLREAGCHTSVTLRTYRHGETVVPPGCSVIPYEERMAHMEGMELVISATTSPHYTITADAFSALSAPPAVLVDLAIPRDIEPAVESLPHIRLFNIDDMGSFSEHRQIPEKAAEIIQTNKDNFYRWLHYKDCMPALDSLKDAITARLCATVDPELLTPEELIEQSVSKAVELLVGGLSDRITSDALERCESKIRQHTIV